MSVLSRIQWHDKPVGGIAHYLSGARARFTIWATSGEQSTLPDGESPVMMADRERTVSLRSVADRGRSLEGVEGVVWDKTADGWNSTTRWTVVVRVVGDDERVDVMVEDRMETSDPARRVGIARPRVVDDLLGFPGRPRLGSLPLLSAPQAIPANGVPILINDVLRLPGRLLPAVVCTQPYGDDGGRWLARADVIAERVRGFANVFTLDREASWALRHRVGNLGVWNGCVRVYSSAPLDRESDGWRHKSFPLSRLRPSWTAGIDRVVETAAALSARLPTPPPLAIFSPSRGAEAVALDRTAALEADLAEFVAENDTLREELEERDNEVNRLRGHLVRLREELEKAGESHVYWGAKDDPGTDAPDTVQDIEEAILAAQSYLSEDLCLPEKAEHDLACLVASPRAAAWGNTAWRGLRALAAYARYRREMKFPGGFWEWCAEGFPEGWPATEKKLSMTESETVRQSPKFNSCRLLPVSTDVDPSGRTYMYSHLKIAEGGSNISPRIYFHDDTRGKTGKIHVGFVGPHYLMPNTQS